MRKFILISVLVLASAAMPPANAEDGTRDGSEFECLIQPKVVLKLGTQVPGLISEMLVDRGAIIKKGDVVARLETG